MGWFFEPYGPTISAMTMPYQLGVALALKTAAVSPEAAKVVEQFMRKLPRTPVDPKSMAGLDALLKRVHLPKKP